MSQMQASSNAMQDPEARKSAFSVELVLIIALPLIAVAASSASAYIAYVKGFTALPEPPAAVHHQKH